MVRKHRTRDELLEEHRLKIDDELDKRRRQQLDEDKVNPVDEDDDDGDDDDDDDGLDRDDNDDDLDDDIGDRNNNSGRRSRRRRRAPQRPSDRHNQLQVVVTSQDSLSTNDGCYDCPPRPRRADVTPSQSRPPPIIIVRPANDESMQCDCTNCQFFSGWCCMPCLLLLLCLSLVVWFVFLSKRSDALDGVETSEQHPQITVTRILPQTSV